MANMFHATRSKLTALVRRAWQPDWRPGIIALALLLVVYVATLQPFVNSSTVPYTQDSAEIQVVLNIGGTLHATGYPLYVLTGLPLVWLFKLAGVSSATAPAVVSLLWSLLALTLLYELLVARTRQPILAATSVFLLGLTESYWLHSVIPEVYSLYLVFVVLILRTALRYPDRQWERKDWLRLALLLGLGVAHHRAVAFLVPALAIYLWPQFWRMRREMPGVLALGTLLFVIGFLPYAYMPLYARLGGLWTHGDPGRLDGFRTEFFGNEFGYLFEPPTNLAELGGHITYIASVLGRVLTWPVFLAGSASLVVLAIGRIPDWGQREGLRPSPTAQSRFLPPTPDAPLTIRSRTGVLVLLAVLAYVGFMVWVPETILPEAFLLPVQMMLIMALCEGLAWLLVRWPMSDKLTLGAGTTLALLAIYIGWQNAPAINALTNDPAGIDFIHHIATLDPAPDGRDTVLMVPLGWRYNVAGYGLYVTHAYGGFELVDHRADFAAILQRGDRLLVTPETLYAHPRDWWQDVTGLPVYLRSGGPGFVEISPEPLADAPPGDAVDLGIGVQLLAYEVTEGNTDDFILTLYWSATDPPEENFSVFVHLLGNDPNLILAQADSYAPVEGFYPVTDWQSGEIVRDAYRVITPRGTFGPSYLRAGMYRQLDDGTFENFEALTIPLP